MKGLRVWVLCSLVGTALIYFNVNCSTTNSLFPAMDLNYVDGSIMMTTRLRKLKEHTPTVKKSNAGTVNLEDYLPIDPVPSSKASLRPGPIQHGTPLKPYIPQHSPPKMPGPTQHGSPPATKPLSPAHPLHGGSP
ncbi:uncharacterized protein LOC131161587 [Malania oleifera]|uniref:uncharacterized protein LOC131161587 n=1 Tax=Malania oleifera TaxID=397392 RepID=UPI0025AECC00|nr:uncharacterized protein LOC131161587 [Malania oleifera]